MLERIEPREKLFRSVNPFNWYVSEKRVSSSLFKNPNGVSVDREWDRSDYQIVIDAFKNRFGNDQVKAVVYVCAFYCYELPSNILYKPEPENDYHSEIHDIDKVELTQGKAKRLAKNCTVIYQCA